MKRKSGAGVAGIPVELLEKMAQRLKLLAHPQRLRIVEILEGSDGAPVNEIMERLGLPQAATSQHLNQMKRLGLLSATRAGKQVLYRIADPRSLTILGCIRRKGEKE